MIILKPTVVNLCQQLQKTISMWGHKLTNAVISIVFKVFIMLVLINA